MSSASKIVRQSDLPDADELQNLASDPSLSVWVAASAGSGKTKVLTDRVLRLLLPAGDGRPGTPPEKILCLTFTKAGAAEMAGRITDVLARWAVEEEDKLHAHLESLLGRYPAAHEMEASRRLFARVIDAEGGLKILTIHSFCQSVLGRFPIEAGLPPHFRLIDERAAARLQQSALETILIGSEESGLKSSIDRLSTEKGEDDLIRLLQGLMNERRRLTAFIDNPDAAFPSLCKMLQISPEETEESLIFETREGADQVTLREAIRVMAETDSANMQKRWPLIQQMLDCAHGDLDRSVYESYLCAFLKQDGEPFKDVVVAAIRKTAPHVETMLLEEQDRVATIHNRMKSVLCARLSHDLLRVGIAVFREYQNQKAKNAALDYDDLIAYTYDLLTGKTMGMSQAQTTPWVMYKLDQGIDHILVDEAQDTNPDQWAIIHALAEEFFSGSGARDDLNRTIFAVGDEKQSIFGFQRAAPEKFREAEASYKQKTALADKSFKSIPMTISFRSTEPVLAVTDAVFNAMNPWDALGLPEGAEVQHFSHRIGQAGLVELWPHIDTQDAEDPEPWALPVKIDERDNAEILLARRIATTIKGWIGREELPAYGRKVEAGDIMILVKSRGTIVDHLVRALKAVNVDVSGVDRMKLAEQIAVQDLLAAARFALLPEDDLSLACLLKSPLIGLNEEGLYDTAIDRDGSLWAAAKSRLPQSVTDWLSVLIAKSGMVRPFEFFSALLTLPCPNPSLNGSSGLKAMMSRLGEDAADPLEEFLNLALDYETDNIPSLQQFLAWQENGDTEIKREMEGAGQKIRIMTVHGSKGLQAPIVILPDTMHSAASIGKIGLADRILWTEAGPLWSPRAEDDCSLYRILIDEKKARLAEEYRRLLYVALTRAAGRLYIAGYNKSSRSKPAPDCWYNLIQKGFTAMGSRVESIPLFEEDVLRISCPQSAAPDKQRKEQDITVIQPACPDWSWLRRNPPEEEMPPRPFMPSRPSEPEPAAQSPLDNTQNQNRFRRGNITHTLLQFLPGLPRESWKNAAENFVGRQKDIDSATQTGIVTEVLNILTHPEFQALFGPGSMAETPITALLGTKLISGQIDRLLITETEIMIVDYKTNRPPPREEKDVPALYRTQLRAYRDVLAELYPKRKIRTFLLWTDGPHMMEVHL